jgi:hypothetical protein
VALLLAITGALAQEYANHAISTRPAGLPGAVPAAWYASWTWFPTLGLALVFTPLLFPDGRLLSRRWRPVAWLAGAATAAITALTALQPTIQVAHGRQVANPVGVSVIENPEQGPTGAVAFLPVAAGVAILRYRLYEIDRLINRTLVYGLLTILLAGVYAGLVLVLGQLFGDLGDQPPSRPCSHHGVAVAAALDPGAATGWNVTRPDARLPHREACP